MAVSAADVRSVFAIPEQKQPTPGPSQQRKGSTSSARKPDGISRELYSLIGPSAPTLVPQLAKPRLKQKPNLGGARQKIKWEWRMFKNSARSDSLELGHWVKASEDPDADYPFARYNVKPTSYEYSQDEYIRFLEDKDWSKEETDYLFEIVWDYDTRWYVINDRYDFPGGPTRSLEDLKDRYFSVCRKLIRNRPWPGDETSKAQLLSSFQFDKEREVTRKKYINHLETRTPEQMVEEEALIIEVKRLEQNERRYKKERDNLLRTLAGIDSGLPDVIEDEGLVALTIDTKKKKKSGGIALDADSPSTPSAISVATPVAKRVPSAANAAYASTLDAAHYIYRTDPASTTKAAHQPATLRSYKLPVPKAAIAPKVTAALAELGISHTRLVMPTRDNVAQLESLLEATTALVDTKRLVDKANYDIQTVKNQLGLRESESVDGERESFAVMELDEGEVIGQNGRSQSVVSTRSRKHARRSVSISSVDTSATGSTRPGTKRQKRS